MELGPKNHDGDGLLGPNSVCMDPLGKFVACRATDGEMVLSGPKPGTQDSADFGIFPIVSIVVPFFGLTKYIIRIL